MTTNCADCGTIPLTYLVVDGRALCKVCAEKRYIKELKELKETYLGISPDTLYPTKEKKE